MEHTLVELFGYLRSMRNCSYFFIMLNRNSNAISSTKSTLSQSRQVFTLLLFVLAFYCGVNCFIAAKIL